MNEFLEVSLTEELRAKFYPALKERLREFGKEKDADLFQQIVRLVGTRINRLDFAAGIHPFLEAEQVELLLLWLWDFLKPHENVVQNILHELAEANEEQKLQITERTVHETMRFGADPPAVLKVCVNLSFVITFSRRWYFVAKTQMQL